MYVVLGALLTVMGVSSVLNDRLPWKKRIGRFKIESLPIVQPEGEGLPAGLAYPLPALEPDLWRQSDPSDRRGENLSHISSLIALREHNTDDKQSINSSIKPKISGKLGRKVRTFGSWISMNSPIKTYVNETIVKLHRGKMKNNRRKSEKIFKDDPESKMASSMSKKEIYALKNRNIYAKPVARTNGFDCTCILSTEETTTEEFPMTTCECETAFEEKEQTESNEEDDSEEDANVLNESVVCRKCAEEEYEKAKTAVNEEVGNECKLDLLPNHFNDDRRITESPADSQDFPTDKSFLVSGCRQKKKPRIDRVNCEKGYDLDAVVNSPDLRKIFILPELTTNAQIKPFHQLFNHRKNLKKENICRPKTKKKYSKFYRRNNHISHIRKKEHVTTKNCKSHSRYKKTMKKPPGSTMSILENIFSKIRGRTNADANASVTVSVDNKKSTTEYTTEDKTMVSNNAMREDLGCHCTTPTTNDPTNEETSLDKTDDTSTHDKSENTSSPDMTESTSSLDTAEKKSSLDTAEKKSSLDTAEKKSSLDTTDDTSSIDDTKSTISTLLIKYTDDEVLDDIINKFLVDAGKQTSTISPYWTYGPVDPLPYDSTCEDESVTLIINMEDDVIAPPVGNQEIFSNNPLSIAVHEMVQEVKSKMTEAYGTTLPSETESKVITADKMKFVNHNTRATVDPILKRGIICTHCHRFNSVEDDIQYPDEKDISVFSGTTYKKSVAKNTKKPKTTQKTTTTTEESTKTQVKEREPVVLNGISISRGNDPVTDADYDQIMSSEDCTSVPSSMLTTRDLLKEICNINYFKTKTPQDDSSTHRSGETLDEDIGTQSQSETLSKKTTTTETSATEISTTETSTTETSTTETSTTETSTTEASTTEASTTEASTTEASTTEISTARTKTTKTITKTTVKTTTKTTSKTSRDTTKLTEQTTTKNQKKETSDSTVISVSAKSKKTTSLQTKSDEDDDQQSKIATTRTSQTKHQTSKTIESSKDFNIIPTICLPLSDLLDPVCLTITRSTARTTRATKQQIHVDDIILEEETTTHGSKVKTTTLYSEVEETVHQKKHETTADDTEEQRSSPRPCLCETTRGHRKDRPHLPHHSYDPEIHPTTRLHTRTHYDNRDNEVYPTTVAIDEAYETQEGEESGSEGGGDSDEVEVGTKTSPLTRKATTPKPKRTTSTRKPKHKKYKEDKDTREKKLFKFYPPLSLYRTWLSPWTAVQIKQPPLYKTIRNKYNSSDETLPMESVPRTIHLSQNIQSPDDTFREDTSTSKDAYVGAIILGNKYLPPGFYKLEDLKKLKKSGFPIPEIRGRKTAVYNGSGLSFSEISPQTLYTNIDSRNGRIYSVARLPKGRLHRKVMVRNSDKYRTGRSKRRITGIMAM